MNVVPDVEEALLLVAVSSVPSTDLGVLAQQLADAVTNLPVSAAAIIGAAETPGDIAAYAQGLGERQEMATAAADTGLLYARLWLRPSAALPADGVDIAIACRTVWEEHVKGVDRSGLVDIVCLPPPSVEGWLRGATSYRSLARTAAAEDGLIPDMEA